ncbi:MAG: nicotinamide-nucleotide amidohydrolase family protein [Synergistaceae bacterium]|jgi:PncC family amidohydrolase|nr:nicotinamide-nucleotide amidohydrolase family protein [Synergistaceae bacterium]
MNSADELRNDIDYLAKEIVRASHRFDRGKPRTSRLFTFAESCTGGLVASSVTGVSGVSEFFPGSAVTYSNRSKIEFLSVTPETIDRHGAVSGECAAEMAWGALRLFDARLAVSVTGVAGPGGGTAEKPVGTVWFALAREDGRMSLRRGIYSGRGRCGVQQRAVKTALKLLLAGLVGLAKISL